MDDRPEVFHHFVTTVVALLILEQHSRYPEAHFLVVLFCFFATLGLGIAYVITVSRQPTRGSRVRTWFNRLFFPLVVLLMISSSVTHWPASVRFRLSEASFDQLVAEANSGKKPQGFPRRVGLYWIEYIYDADFDYTTGSGSIGFVTGSPLIDDCGLSYDPKNPESSHFLTTRISPCWYVTEW